MNIFEFLDREIVPISVIIIYLYVFRKRIFDYFRKGAKNAKFFKNAIKILARNFRFSIDNWKYTILIPIAITLILDIFLTLYFRTVMTPYDEPLWFLLTFRTFFNPIAEEIMSRGFILGVGFLGIVNLLELGFKRKVNRIIYVIWVLFSLIASTYVFSISHENPDYFSSIVRFSGGLLYGTLFLLNKKNLLPSTVAHIVHNLIITLTPFLM